MPLPLRLLAPVLIGLLAACEVVPPSTLAPGEPCDPRGGLRCAGAGARCLPLAEGGGVCSHPCTTDAGCVRGFTCQLEPSGTSAFCRPGFRCAEDAECPSGHRCDVAAGLCFVPVQRELCSSCVADAQCPPGGRCIEVRATGERFCSVPCEEGACPAGYDCDDGQCLPHRRSCEAGRPLCAPCVGNPQCGTGSDLCLENFLSGERFCGTGCNPLCMQGPDGGRHAETGERCNACPDNFQCTDLGGDGVGPFQCVPDAATCEGWCESDAACPLGHACDPVDHQCLPASDGRACAPCRDDDSCGAASLCVSNVETGETFCAPGCGEGGACGLGFVCAEVAETAVCVPAGGSCLTGAGRLGEPCGDGGAAACLTGICLRSGGSGLCSASCSADQDCGDATWRCCAVVPGEAGARWDCEREPSAGGGVCAPRGGGFGDACDRGRPPCQDGHCLDLGTGRVCTAGCVTDDDCHRAAGASGSFVCRAAREVAGGDAPGDTVHVCFPAGGGEVGSDCTFGPAACATRLCITKASGNVCTATCATADECPAGWSCEETTTLDGERLRVCLPPPLGR